LRSKATLPELTPFESCLHLLTNMRETLNILQVGANDGAINDPLYGFVSANPRRTRIILCEPQSYLIPELERSYAFHDARYIHNGTVGPASTLRMHRVRREHWEAFSVPYARGWPVWRAPTGVTSANRDHVLAWVRKHCRGSLRPGDVIEEVSVECLDMAGLLRRAGLFDRVDVLQIDAEGFDDQVIYASDLGRLRSLVVNLEYRNLSQGRATDLRAFLARQGYVFSPHGMDGLAIRSAGVEGAAGAG
jgi:FkbM family methyltransferase